MFTIFVSEELTPLALNLQHSSHKTDLNEFSTTENSHLGSLKATCKQHPLIRGEEISKVSMEGTNNFCSRTELKKYMKMLPLGYVFLPR